MTNINESKVLLETEFKDSLGEEEFQVKIIQHFGNPVFGDKIKVDVKHPEENFIETYAPKEFPEQFYSDLDFRGWSFVLGELKEKL